MTSRIEDYAIVGDLHSAALIAMDGSVDWLCLPRFDWPACFAALLDNPGSGRWLLAPAGGGRCSRRNYRGDTLVLETWWETASGCVRVVDFMPPRGKAPDLVRIVEGVTGSVQMSMELVVRFDYGHIVPWVRRVGGRWSATAGPDSLWLDTEAPLTGENLTTTSRFTVSAGQRIPFVLTWASSYRDPPRSVDPEGALDDTVAFWEQWIDRCSYRGRYDRHVRRSLVTLKALTYAPTGGIVAAATTSLPEQIGGVRNWDYRYCWLRDAAFTLQALAGAGFVDEAGAWREWLLRAVAGDPSDLQIMYSVTGRRRLPEAELPWLAGYEGSRPVRIGNAAATQFQLDVWGEVLDALHTARDSGLAADEEAWTLQQALLDFLEGAWRQPDSSLWEVRGPQRHFVHSKVMAWVGFDRMLRTADRAGIEAPTARWRGIRDEIHADVCTHGYDADRNTFTQSYGEPPLDAALLLLPRVGFLPADDPRVHGTIEAVRRELCEDGFVLRYRTGTSSLAVESAIDGLPGSEGAFLACTFWLADALALSGRTEEATELFHRLLDLQNDVGLLSEQYDPVTRRQLGNTPQAFSHVELVDTALGLDRSTRHLSSHRP